MSSHNHLIKIIRAFWENRRDNACFISYMEENGHLTPEPEPTKTMLVYTDDDGVDHVQDHMRELMINELEAWRQQDGFSSQTMRWDDFYWCHGGIARLTRKAAKRGGFIHLSETTRQSFEEMDDCALFATYNMIIRQTSKQM
jgi:hypothetical protein